MEALIVISYFVIGLALFFSFWRWGALEGDGEDVGNKTISFMLLFFWPVTIVFMVLCFAWLELVECGKRVMKK